MTLAEKYWGLCKDQGDIHEHLPILRAFASQVEVVVELGVRCGVSTVGLLMGEPKMVYSYDVMKHPFLEPEQIKPAPNWKFIIGDSREVVVPFCGLLFIDTLHNKAQLEKELALHAQKASKFIILHDTVTFGEVGEDGGPGIGVAIERFLDENNWEKLLDLKNNNGLMVLRRTV